MAANNFISFSPTFQIVKNTISINNSKISDISPDNPYIYKYNKQFENSNDFAVLNIIGTEIPINVIWDYAPSVGPNEDFTKYLYSFTIYIYQIDILNTNNDDIFLQITILEKK